MDRFSRFLLVLLGIATVFTVVYTVPQWKDYEFYAKARNTLDVIKATEILYYDLGEAHVLLARVRAERVNSCVHNLGLSAPPIVYNEEWLRANTIQTLQVLATLDNGVSTSRVASYPDPTDRLKELQAAIAYKLKWWESAKRKNDDAFFLFHKPIPSERVIERFLSKMGKTPVYPPWPARVSCL